MELVTTVLNKGNIFKHFRFEDDTDVYVTIICNCETEFDVENYGNKSDNYYINLVKIYLQNNN